ncbi:MAG: M28 family metallopeptidase [Bdellovibrionota bacterium]
MRSAIFKRLMRVFPRLSPRAVLIRSGMICALLGVVLFGLNLKRIEPLPVSEAPLHFEAKNAYDEMTTLAKRFPNRFTWAPPRRQAADWLKSEFRKLGYVPQGMPFSEVIAGKQYSDLENVFVEKKGTTHPDEIIAVVAHYDVTDTTVEGAMDDASGIGVVLELARIFAQENPSRTILFLATDSEEFGAFWGATNFARSYPKASQIVGIANFDFISPEHVTKILTLCDGLQHGYTPLWLRELALDSVRSVGLVRAVDFSNVIEFVERAMQIPPADHGAFLAAGIPAFNWVGQTDNFGHIMAHYHHTKADVAEAMEVGSFESYGKSAERLVRSIDELPRIPANFRNSSYWKISEAHYLEGWVVTLLHLLAFLPFLAYSIARFGRMLANRPLARVLQVVRNEAKSVVILFGSLLLGYAVMLLLPILRIIAAYEIFPATQKSAILYNPNFLAMLFVLVCVVVVYWVFKKTFAEPEDSLGHVEIRQAVHAAVIALIITLAFIKNSYLAVLLLLPPAYLWTALQAKRRTPDRLLNLLLLLGGSITLIAITAVLTTIFHVGVAYWYLVLSAAYGLFSAYAVILFFLALTVMIRLFRSFVL